MATRKKTAKKEARITIRRGMPVSDIVTLCPEAESLLAEYGLHCFRCDQNALETLEEGCRSHGFEDEEIDELVNGVNRLLAEKPGRPRSLTVTADAARAISGVAEDEGRTGQGLAVIVDGQGGFCMEFRADPGSDEETFCNTEVPEVRIFASHLTLSRIGGSTIDFRDGRFKLDLPQEDKAGAACGCAGGRCACSETGAAARRRRKV